MTNDAIDDRLQSTRNAVNSRLTAFPGHPLFTFASHELDKIENVIRSGRPIDTYFYQQIKIGLMCAKELETSDPAFCDLVYDMLEEIRKEASRP